jgi:hypothetical protein
VIRAALVTLLLGGCTAEIVDLGRGDAAVDAAVDVAIDAPTSCRCRITPCRVAGDCALIGGACGPDSYCVGDFGPCAHDADCRATASASACTTGTTSTTPCP